MASGTFIAENGSRDADNAGPRVLVTGYMTEKHSTIGPWMVWSEKDFLGVLPPIRQAKIVPD